MNLTRRPRPIATNTRASSIWAGTPIARRRSPGRSARRCPGGRQAYARPKEIPAWDDSIGRREEGLCAPDGELYGLPRIHRRADRPRGRRCCRERPTRQHPGHLHRRRQRRLGRRRPGGHGQRHRQPQRHPAGLARSARRSSTRSAGRRPSRTSRSVGRWAADTPFQWTKQVASHFGGTRNPMVVSWPKRIGDKGGLRSQFLHCIDVAPTILEAAGIPQPQVVNGVAAEAHRGRELRVHLRFRDRAGSSHHAIFRDDGQPGDLQGWLDRGDAPRHSLDDRWTSHRLRQGRVGTLRPVEGLHRSRELAAQKPGQAEGTASRSSTRKRARTMSCPRRPHGRTLRPLEPAEPARRAHELHLWSRCRLRPGERGDQHAQRSVFHHGGNRSWCRFCPGRHCGHGRKDFRLVALREERSTDLLLQLLRVWPDTARSLPKPLPHGKSTCGSSSLPRRRATESPPTQSFS